MGDNDHIDILLVEDIPSDAELVVRALNKIRPGIKIKHVEDGAEAISFFFGNSGVEDRGVVPRLVLLDLNMPKISGLEVLRRIRNEKRTRKIPVVVFTSSKEDADVSSCYELGVNSYIVKPVEFHEFTMTITSLGQYWLGLNLPAE